MRAIDIAREYFPEYSDNYLNDLLWEYTGFPEFWHIPEDGNTPEECLRTQLQRIRDGKKHDADRIPARAEGGDNAGE